METVIMTLLKWMRPLLRGRNVDPDQVIAIVQVKLRMDKRRVYMNWRSNQQTRDRNQLLRALIFYAIMGFLMGSLVEVLDSFLTVMVFLHVYFLFMMSMTLVTDFSAVMLDTTDNQVILPRPVSSRTLFTARIVHILLYLLQFAVAISAGSWLFTFIRYGLWAGMVLMFTSLLTVLLAVFFTWFLYLAVLRFANEQKVKDIITYFQIAMTVFFTLGFQIFPRLINMADLRSNVSFSGWTFVLPPVWMAMTNEAFLLQHFDGIHLAMIAAAVIIPLAGFWMINRFLAPIFAQKLSAMQGSAGTDSSSADVQKGKAGRGNSLSAFWSRKVCSSVEEEGSFEASWRITSRDKGFRMQFYPALAYIFVFFFIFVLKGSGSLRENWNGLPTTKNFLWLIYLPLMTISNGFTLAQFNEQFAATWIYYSSPIIRPGDLISGMAKMILVKFFVPVFVLLSAINIWLWGIGIWPDILFGFFANLACYFSFTLITEIYLPFSRQPNVRQQSGRFIKAIVQLLLVAILVGLHYLLVRQTIFLLVATPLLALATYYLIRRLRSISWNAIKV